MSQAEYNELKAELAEIRGLLVQLVQQDKMLTIGEAAAYLNCSTATVRRRINAGEIVNHAPPRKPIRIKASDLIVHRGGGIVSALSIL